MTRAPRTSTLFPYTTLFRSVGRLGPSTLPITMRATPMPPATNRNSRVGRYSASTLVLSGQDRKSTRLNSSHVEISYAVFCLKKKKLRSYTWTHAHSIFADHQ